MITTMTPKKVARVSGETPQIACEQAGDPETREEADQDPEGDQDDSLAQNHPQNVVALCPECHTNTDFASAKRHRVSHNAVDANRGEQQADSRKEAEREDAKLGLGVGIALQKRCKSACFGEGDVMIDGPNFLAHIFERETGD